MTSYPEELNRDLQKQQLEHLTVQLEVLKESYFYIKALDSYLFESLHKRLCKLEEKFWKVCNTLLMSRTKKDSQAIWIDSTVHQQLKLIAAMNDRTIGDEAGEVLKKHIKENQHKVLSAFEKK